MMLIIYKSIHKLPNVHFSLVVQT